MSRHARFDRLDPAGPRLSRRRLLVGLAVFLVGLALWATQSRSLGATVATLGCVLVVDGVATGARLWLVAGGLVALIVGHLLDGRAPSLVALSVAVRVLGLLAVLAHLHYLLDVRG